MRHTDARLHTAARLAGPFIDRGLSANDGDTLLGTLLLTPSQFVEILERRKMQMERPLIDLIVEIVGCGEEAVEILSVMATIARRFEAYEEDRLRWESRTSQSESWRSRPASTGQRHLIQSICLARKIPMPVLVNRGTAHDWIDNDVPLLVELAADIKGGL